MVLFVLILFFVLGTIAGSFMNVLVFRLNAGGRGRGRSFCFACGRTLQPRDLIPIVSFLMLRGRCRYCQSRISLQYPLVELITGLVFVSVFYKYSLLTTNYLLLTLDLLLWSSLIALSVYDIRHKIIPGAFVYSFLFLSFLHLTFNFQLSTFNFLDFWGGPLLAAFPALLFVLSRGRAMGFGDAKLLLGFSWFVGFIPALSATVLGFWLGAAFALIGFAVKALAPASSVSPGRLNSALRRFRMKSELPLAPFLVLGLFIVYLTGIEVTGLSQLLAVRF